MLIIISWVDRVTDMGLSHENYTVTEGTPFLSISLKIYKLWTYNFFQNIRNIFPHLIEQIFFFSDYFLRSYLEKTCPLRYKMPQVPLFTFKYKCMPNWLSKICWCYYLHKISKFYIVLVRGVPDSPNRFRFRFRISGRIASYPAGYPAG